MLWAPHCVLLRDPRVMSPLLLFRLLGRVTKTRLRLTGVKDPPALFILLVLSLHPVDVLPYVEFRRGDIQRVSKGLRGISRGCKYPDFLRSRVSPKGCNQSWGYPRRDAFWREPLFSRIPSLTKCEFKLPPEVSPRESSLLALISIAGRRL